MLIRPLPKGPFGRLYNPPVRANLVQGTRGNSYSHCAGSSGVEEISRPELVKDDITWEGPTLSGVPLIVDSEAVDGIYFATMPEGFTAVDENRQGLADLSEYIDKYNARLSVGHGGYGNTADDTESEAKILD